MTKPREPGSAKDALARSLALLGPAAAEAATGKSAGHLRLCSDPDEEREARISDALQLTAALAAAGDADPPFLALFRRTVETALPPAPDGAAEPEDPELVLLRAVHATGNLGGGFARALQDGSLSPRERRALKELVLELRHHCDAMTAALDQDPTERRLAETQAAVQSLRGRVLNLGRRLQIEERRRLKLQNAAATGKGARRGR